MILTFDEFIEEGFLSKTIDRAKSGDLRLEDRINIMALYIGEYAGDNLNLTTGRDKICMVWRSTNDKVAYVLVNGGVSTVWRTFDDIPLKTNWTKRETTEISGYSHAGTIGGTNKLKISIYTTTVTEKEMDSLYKLGEKDIIIRDIRYYATSDVKMLIEDCETKNYI